MKMSNIRFGQLRRVLLDLHFTETRDHDYWRYEHTPSGTTFVFRPYSTADHAAVPDIASTRQHLDWRGLVPESGFDQLLAKTPA